MAIRRTFVGALVLLAACSASPAEKGADVAKEVGCHSCHTEVNTDLAPTLNGIWGSSVRLSDGSEVLVDAAYVERSIVDPQREIVTGYENGRMPTFFLTEDEVDQLVEYVRSLN